MRKRIVLVFFILTISLSNAFAENTNDDLEQKYNGVLELSTSNSFISFIGATADNLLTKLQDAIIPGIVRLTYNQNASTNSNSQTVNVGITTSSSFIGKLLTVLLTIECVVLGIKSFLGCSGNFIEIVKHFLMIAITLIFIALLPLIADSVLNIFTTMGAIAGGVDVKSGEYFPFRPSSVISIFGNIKNTLDLCVLSLSGTFLAKLPYILIIYMAVVIIAIPFCIVSVLVIFWYLEFSFIVLSGTVLLPFTVFSYTSITDMKSILKALLLEGIKIFLGVFIATLTGSVIKNSLLNFNTSAGNVLNLIVYMLLMSAVFVFGITKGPECVLNAINGNVANNLPKSGIGGFILGSITSAIRPHNQDRTVINNETNDRPIPSKETSNQSILPVSPINLPTTKDNSMEKENKNDNVQNEIITLPIVAPKTKGKKETPYIDSKATTKRITEAYNAFKEEGVKNVSISEAKERARWDANWQKLVKMEKSGFKDKNGNIDKEAKKQYQKMKSEKSGYINGYTTYKGDKKE